MKEIVDDNLGTDISRLSTNMTLLGESVVLKTANTTELEQTATVTALRPRAMLT